MIQLCRHLWHRIGCKVPPETTKWHHGDSRSLSYRFCRRYATHAIYTHHLTHWGRVTHICIGKSTAIGSGNGLARGRRQAIIWTNVGLLLIGPLGTNFSEILIKIQTFSLKEIRLKMSFAKCCQFCLGLNVLRQHYDICTFWGYRKCANDSLIRKPPTD